MIHPKQQFIKDTYGKEPESLDEIAQACIAVIDKVCKSSVIGFAWNVAYERNVSNSHNGPVAGHSNFGGRNSKANGVRSYPGFYGRVWIRFTGAGEFMSLSDHFEKTLTYTGSGGGGAYDGLWSEVCSAAYRSRNKNGMHNYPEPHCFSWDYRFFASDFLGIQDTIVAEIAAHELAEDEKYIWAELNTEYYKRKEFALRHRFEWENPTVKEADAAFIQHYRQNLITA